MPLLVFLVLSPPVWATIGIILILAAAQFTRFKFIHPTRTERWRPVNLALVILWVVLAGWSIWSNFDPPQAVRVGLLVASLWVLLVGIVMQVLPERRLS